MAMFKKLFTALKGGINEAGEAIVDTQALRILDQEIRDADDELKTAKESLANIMARKKLAENKVNKTQAKITEYEGYAIKALESNDETLALEVAGKIASLENEIVIEKSEFAEYEKNVALLRQTVTQTEANIRNLKQQVDIVKATESLQKAQKVVSERYGNSTEKLQTALDSLERIKDKQAHTAATLEAKSELSAKRDEDQLDQKLQAAGIKPKESDAAAVLARLKQSQSNS